MCEEFIRTYPLHGLAEKLMRKEKEDRIKEDLFFEATYEGEVKSIYEGEKEEE